VAGPTRQPAQFRRFQKHQVDPLNSLAVTTAPPRIGL